MILFVFAKCLIKFIYLSINKSVTNNMNEEKYINSLWQGINDSKDIKQLNHVFNHLMYINSYLNLRDSLVQNNLFDAEITPNMKLWNITTSIPLKLIMCYKLFHKKVFINFYQQSQKFQDDMTQQNPDNFLHQKNVITSPSGSSSSSSSSSVVSQSIGSNHRIFELILVNESNLELFETLLKCYYVESKLSRLINIMAGFDFEFNNTHQKSRASVAAIGLIQLCITYHREKHLFLIDPNLFSDICEHKEERNLITQYIFVNQDISKTTHGSDSLDLPYICRQLLCMDRKLITTLLQNYYDTKLLHETFSNLLSYLGTDTRAKSNLYDAMHHMKVITDQDYKYLVSLEKKIGKKDIIVWKLSELKEKQMEYAIGDIMYLPDLTTVIRREHTILHYENYYQAMLAIQRLTFLHKSTNILSTLEIDCYKLNTVLYDTKNNELKQMITIVDTLIDQKAILPRYNLPLKVFMGVDYYRGIVVFLFRLLTYYQIWKQKIKVYSKKNQVAEISGIGDIYEAVYKIITESDLPELIYWMKIIKKHIKSFLGTIMPS